MTLTNLKTSIYQRLLSLVQIAVYNKNAPDNADYPFIVYNLSSFNNSVRDTRNDYILDVDIWNNSYEESSMLSAYDSIELGLNKYYSSDANGFWISDLDGGGEIPTQDKTQTRLNLRFIIREG